MASTPKPDRTLTVGVCSRPVAGTRNTARGGLSATKLGPPSLWWGLSCAGTERTVVFTLHRPFESFPIPGEQSQSLLTYSAEPGSPSQDALSLLASWAATADASEKATATDDSHEAGSLRDA